MNRGCTHNVTYDDLTKMEELFEKIAHNIEPKESFQIVVNDTKTRFVTKFNPYIQFKKTKATRLH